MGRTGEVPVPVAGPFGGTEIVYVESDLDEELLQQIAEKAGGQYFRATDTADLQRIYQRIDELEKSQIEITHYSQEIELIGARRPPTAVGVSGLDTPIRSGIPTSWDSFTRCHRQRSCTAGTRRAPPPRLPARAHSGRHRRLAATSARGRSARKAPAKRGKAPLGGVRPREFTHGVRGSRAGYPVRGLTNGTPLEYHVFGELDQAPLRQGQGEQVAMQGTAAPSKRTWQPMALSYVGDVAAVMQKKSGQTFDPSPVHLNKRGNGPKNKNF